MELVPGTYRSAATNFSPTVLPKPSPRPWPISANLGVPMRNSGKNRPLSVIPGLDPGTSWRRLTGGLQAEVQILPAKLLKGGARIESGYDGRVEENAYGSAHATSPRPCPHPSSCSSPSGRGRDPPRSGGKVREHASQLPPRTQNPSSRHLLRPPTSPQPPSGSSGSK